RLIFGIVPPRARATSWVAVIPLRVWKRGRRIGILDEVLNRQMEVFFRNYSLDHSVQSIAQDWLVSDCKCVTIYLQKHFGGNKRSPLIALKERMVTSNSN